MAYVTGTAATLADLLTAINNACTANGWTLAGSVLHKGSCFVEMKINGSHITLRGGSGVDGSNNLTGATDQGLGLLGLVIKDTTHAIPFGWPVTYFIHMLTAPDEVYVIVNYGVTYYQNLAWGTSTIQGLGGSGTWYSGCSGADNTVYGGLRIGGEFVYTSNCGVSLFARLFDSLHTDGVDYNLDGVATWSVAAADSIGAATRDWWTLISRQPNVWNSEAILIPIRAYAQRPSGFYSPVLECAHARHVHAKYLTDQQIITIGTDKWKIYPWWHKGISISGNDGRDDSWYAAHAIRYDGP